MILVEGIWGDIETFGHSGSIELSNIVDIFVDGTFSRNSV
jgi:hypothetical protein